MNDGGAFVIFASSALSILYRGRGRLISEVINYAVDFVSTILLFNAI